ncbi:MAG: AAA family ATPase [Colwellia sp.]
MYRNFFSLSDLPFSIAPDPKYLFMSERHKEALSHLTYGLGEIGGFALLTGEVGTGKTTVSRCLMEQLSENTQAVFILNPMLSSQELLATLCDKLELDYQKEDISLKNLTDKISEKLLENHDNGINTLLIIDEAQHLQPEVLEQLRLLTNLETNTKKLLQVILIGQPELQQLLQRRDLRQLAQRITARYHLMPLTKIELYQYIQHRLSIADCTRKIFDKGALDKIHQLTQGVPRLINLLCHSALMLAYNQNDSVVNKKTVIAAAETALGAQSNPNSGFVHYRKALILPMMLSVAALMVLVGFWVGQNKNTVSQTITVSENDNARMKRISSAEELSALTDESVLTDDKTIADVTQKLALRSAGSLPSRHYSEIAPIEVDINQEYNNHQQEVTSGYALHTVQYGDSLYSISLKYNTKISALRQWNNIFEGEGISIGDKLHVIAPKEALYQAAGTKKTLNHTDVKDSQEEPIRVVSAEENVQLHNANQDKDFNIRQVDGVSSDLFARFQAAIDDTEDESAVKNQSVLRTPSLDLTSTSIKSVSQLSPSLQNALPKMEFEQHIYASDGEGWVTVNGRDRYEGDYINADLRVEKILPQRVILSFKGEQFSMPALTNW